MSRRVLVVEPDAAGRAMMDRVLTGAGHAAEPAASAYEARALFDEAGVEVVVIDELAGAGAALEEVRWVRARYPTVPVVVTGALLSRRVMQELVRLRVADVLAKPFTPAELRDAVARAIEQRAARHDEALEYDASLTDARRAMAAGLLDRARAPLARAHAMSPLDAEVMALYALVAELTGKDTDADRGYRAALALREEEATPAPDPHEGLARLAAFGAALPVAALSDRRASQPIWIASDPTAELRVDPSERRIDEPSAHIVVLSLGLTRDEGGAVFFRDGPGTRAFVLLAGSLRVESVAASLGALGPVGGGPLRATDATRARFDIARAEALRAEALHGEPLRAGALRPTGASA